MSDIKISQMEPWTGAVTGNVEFPAVYANQNYRIALSQLTPSTFGFGSMALQNSDAVSITGGNVAVTALSGAITIANGGTGLGDAPANGQLLIGNGSGYTLSTLSAGSGISITNTAGGIQIAASGVGGGTVTSVGVDGQSTGLTFSNSPITTSGTIVMGGVLNVGYGGTGATTAAGARANLGAAKSGANSDITSLSGLTTPLSVTQGGTGASGGLSGYIFGNGSLAFTSVASIPMTDITGTLPVNKGGTGSTSASGARANLLNSYGGNAGKILAVNASATDTEWIAVEGTGTVTSVNVSGGTTGLTTSGGPITAAGTITIAGTLNVASGGTGSGTAAGARINLLPSYAGNVGKALVVSAGEADTEWATVGTVTSVGVSGGTTGLTFSGGPITSSGAVTLGGTLSIVSGGTGATTAGGARTNLGLGSAATLDAGTALGVATLDAGGTIPLSQLPSSIQGGVSYQGAWDASTNTPTLTSSVGAKGYYYVVSVAGATNLNGITDWLVGDWAIFNGSVWQKIDNTESVTSVNGFTGTVVLTTTDVAEGTNQYFTTARSRTSVSAGTGISYNSTTGVITNSAPDQTVSISAGTGISVTGTYPSFAVTNTAPDQVVALTAGSNITITGSYPNFTIAAAASGGTVTSVSGTGTVNGITLSGTVTSSGSLTLGGTLSVDLSTTTVTGTLPVARGGTGTGTAFTTGSVVFASTSGVYSQNNSKLFWDNTNFRLGVGTPTPSSPLTVAGVIESTSGGIKYPDGSTQTAAGVSTGKAIAMSIVFGG